jgi:hypothetical protein
MPILTRKTTLEWSNSIPTPVKNAFRVFDLKHDVNVINPIANANYVGAFQSDHGRIGARSTSISFASELRGYITTVAPPEGMLLQACGFEYANDSPGGFSYTLGDIHINAIDGLGDLLPVSLYKNSDGILWSATGCVGDVTINFPEKGIPYFAWDFKGNYVAVPSAQAQSAFYAGKYPVAVKNEGLTFAVEGGSTYTDLVIRSLTLALNNEVVERPSMNATYGIDTYVVTGREPIYTMVVEQPYDLDPNWEDLYLDQAEINVSFVHNDGGSTGEQVTVEFDAYIDAQPVASENNGLLVYTLVMRQSIDSGAEALSFHFD